MIAINAKLPIWQRPAVIRETCYRDFLRYLKEKIIIMISSQVEGAIALITDCSIALNNSMITSLSYK
jgi:hypothetical protein